MIPDKLDDYVKKKFTWFDHEITMEKEVPIPIIYLNANEDSGDSQVDQISTIVQEDNRIDYESTKSTIVKGSQISIKSKKITKQLIKKPAKIGRPFKNADDIQNSEGKEDNVVTKKSISREFMKYCGNEQYKSETFRLGGIVVSF